MKIYAVILSPLVGTLVAYIIIRLIGTYLFTIEGPFICFIIYFFAILAQIFFVEIILNVLKSIVDFNFLNYLNLAYTYCMFIAITLIIIYLNDQTFKKEEAFEVFLFFFIYVISNALTYNALYFKNQKN